MAVVASMVVDPVSVGTGAAFCATGGYYVSHQISDRHLLSRLRYDASLRLCSSAGLRCGILLSSALGLVAAYRFVGAAALRQKKQESVLAADRHICGRDAGRLSLANAIFLGGCRGICPRHGTDREAVHVPQKAAFKDNNIKKGSNTAIAR